MTDLRKAAEMALEALEEINKLSVGERAICLPGEIDDAMEALRQALEESANSTTDFVEPKAPFQTEQEPAAWGMPREDGVILDVICPDEHDREPGNYTIPLYTAPPKREWVGLTRRELDIATLGLEDLGDCYMAIEAKLKEKNA